jgi:thiol-disulfide isomerase/thioredoxin
MVLINKLYFILILALFLASCETTDERSKDAGEGVEVTNILRTPDEVIKEDGLTVGLHTYERFKPYLEAENDTIYVVNFWATWCKPCVEELPYFEELYQNYKDKKVRLILVSLDFEKEVASKLIPFMNKNKLQGEVIVLRQKGMNDWIDKIDPSWSGALPATIIYNKDKRAFFEQSFDYNELEEKLQEFL